MAKIIAVSEKLSAPRHLDRDCLVFVEVNPNTTLVLFSNQTVADIIPVQFPDSVLKNYQEYPGRLVLHSVDFCLQLCEQCLAVVEFIDYRG